MQIRLALAFLIAVPTAIAHSQITGAPAAQPDNALRPTLENAYHAWRQAMAAGDLSAWERVTAYSRQVETRNRIVSQRMPFPEALFSDPVSPPSLDGMTPLGVYSTGQTATSTYYGRADFGGGPAEVTNNLLVLHFLREEGAWRFDNLRVVKAGGDSELLLKIRNSDFSFLHGVEFQPAPQLPPLPQPVEAPEFLAEAWIDSTGHRVTVKVNGHLTGTFTNARVTELVMGGLSSGGNTIEIAVERAPESAGTRPPKVEVAIYAAKDAAQPATRVYHFNPGATVPPLTQDSFPVE